MEVKDLDDFDAEIRRLNKNLNATVPQIRTREERIAADGYANVPDNIRKSNRGRLKSLEKKLSELQKAISKLENLKQLEGSCDSRQGR
jgi:peptidoglycan hydrolase CwlO-like protein